MWEIMIFPYEAEDGSKQILHFHGHGNFRAGMEAGKQYFPDAEKLLIAGDSAGAFAVPALTREILDDFYPDCRDVTLLSDSGQLFYNRWRTTAREIWKTDASIWRPLKGENITLDWYRDLYRHRGDSLKYLYASSVRDYLLSAYYNDVANKVYRTDAEVQEIFRKQLRHMVRDLKKLTSRFCGVSLRLEKPLFKRGGTVHTAVRHRRFYTKIDGISMAQWLAGAVEGNLRDVGLELL